MPHSSRVMLAWLRGEYRHWFMGQEWEHIKLDNNKAVNQALLKAFITETVRSRWGTNAAGVPLVTDEGISIEQVKHFSVFEHRHTVIAAEVIAQLEVLPLEDCIQSLANLRANNLDDMNFCEYLARRTFAKRRDTRNCHLPPVYQTNPRLFFSLDVNPTGQVFINKRTGTDLDPEHRLAWYREDTGLCVHHVKWHLAYPFREPKQHRQGELFAYMHEQMLARYDFERLGEGFDRVRPYGPGYGFDEPIPQGHNCHLYGFAFRPAGLTVSTIDRDGINVQLSHFELQVERVKQSLERGWFEAEDGGRVTINMDLLGCTMESNQGSANVDYYGNIHNEGHLLIGCCHDPDGRFQTPMSAMMEDATAERDPIFYRWHKFLDNMFNIYRRSLPQYTADDMIFRGIEIFSLTTISNGAENELVTYKENVRYEIYNVPDNGSGSNTNYVTKKSLNHVPFKYCIKINNTTSYPKFVTIRIFIGPDTDTKLDDQNTTFVEMDKFVEKVEPGYNTIIRSDAESSVIVTADASVECIRRGQFDPSKKPNCGCGWPLPLLVPKGTSHGMKTQLFAIATDWTDDRTNKNSNLRGSVSYCGKSGRLYPDKKPMGFPFERSFSYKTLTDLVKEVPNSMVTNVKITFIEKYQQYKLIRNAVRPRS